MVGTWYQLRLPEQPQRDTRRYRADTDAVALTIALGLVRARVKAGGGRGVLWRLDALAGGPRSDTVRRVDG